MRACTVVVALSLFLAATVAAQPSIVRAFPSLSFTSPVDLQHAGDGTNRLFVVEQAGRIRVFPNEASVTSANVFLDIRPIVRSGGELGLLGLAFHPNYASNGFFYINYTRGTLGSLSDPLKTVIARYQVSADPDRADSLSGQVLLEFAQPYVNHNGGQLAFGSDGYLYIATGDGGSGGDPQNNAQNRATLLGKILRIDVNSSPYAIPPTNPYAGNAQGYREEIYAYGLRNPWRFSFDPSTGWLWAADVGQGAWEEIDVVTPGGNYGWRIMEGFSCYNASSCDTAGLILPIWNYFHEPTGGYSITGGHVYRGAAAPELTGKYIYGDYVTRRLWALTYDGTGPAVNEYLLTASASPSSFGLDEQGELYLVDLVGGGLYRFDSASSTGTSTILPDEVRLFSNYPNPFNSQTVIPFTLPRAGDVSLTVFDVRGRFVRHLLSGPLAGGDHTAQWDGTDAAGTIVPSGVYTVQLLFDGRPASAQSMTLLK